MNNRFSYSSKVSGPPVQSGLKFFGPLIVTILLGKLEFLLQHLDFLFNKISSFLESRMS